MKRCSAIIVLIVMCIGLCSCFPNSELKDFEEYFSTDSGEASEGQSETQPFAEKIYVIIPQISSGALAEKARNLCSEIERKTGVTCVFKYDNEQILTDENSTEILLGNTKRIESSEMLREMKQGEYVCQWYSGCIILGGKSEDATSAAIDEFKNKILYGASSVTLMGKDVHFEKKIEFDVDKVLLNGYNLFDFSIVYPYENLNGEKQMATVLRDHIAKKSGYYLNVIDNNSLNGQGGKFIYIGDCSTVGDNKNKYAAFVEKNENGVTVYGKDTYSLSYAISYMTEKLFSDISGRNALCDIDEIVLLNESGIRLTVGKGVCCGKADLFLLEYVIQKITDINCDILSFGVVNKTIAEIITDNLPNEYSSKLGNVDDDNVFLLIYKANTVSVGVIEQLTQEYKVTVTSKSTDENFTLTHLSEDGEEIARADIILSDVDAENIKQTYWNIVNNGKHLFGDKVYFQTALVNDNIIIEGNAQSEERSKNGWHTAFLTFDISAEYHKNYLSLKNT